MFRQHVPGFVDIDPKEAHVSTLEEVLALPWVHRWAEIPNHKFDMWTVEDDTLIAVYDGGTYWWVVGYSRFKLDLPSFKDNHIPKKVERALFQTIPYVETDGRFYYIVKGNENNKLTGYREDSNEWKLQGYTRYPSKEAAQQVLSRISNDNKT